MMIKSRSAWLKLSLAVFAILVIIIGGSVVIHDSSHGGVSVASEEKLLAGDGAASDNFGYSVSVSGDTAVVGAFDKNSGKGAAYVFVRSGSAWVQQAELTSSDGAANDFFGISVSVDGDTAVVGASYKNSAMGAAYVFVRSGSTWSQQAKLLAGDAATGDNFGFSVSVSGDTAVVGAYLKSRGQGAAYVFTRSGSTWSQQSELTAGVTGNNYFGVSVSVSGDTAVIGADLQTSATGAAYVFTRSGSTWSQQAKLTAGDAAAGDYFGISVSVSGGTVLVGADIHASATGAAYVFVNNGSGWSQQSELTARDGVAGDYFGYSVSVSGNTAVVGAYFKNKYQGVAYIFVNNSSTWSQQSKLTARDGAENDYFGYAVSVSGDTVVVGASYKNSLTGAAYVYRNLPASKGPYIWLLVTVGVVIVVGGVAVLVLKKKKQVPAVKPTADAATPPAAE